MKLKIGSFLPFGKGNKHIVRRYAKEFILYTVKAGRKPKDLKHEEHSF